MWSDMKRQILQLIIFGCHYYYSFSLQLSVVQIFVKKKSLLELEAIKLFTDLYI